MKKELRPRGKNPPLFQKKKIAVRAGRLYKTSLLKSLMGIEFQPARPKADNRLHITDPSLMTSVPRSMGKKFCIIIDPGGMCLFPFIVRSFAVSQPIKEFFCKCATLKFLFFTAAMIMAELGNNSKRQKRKQCGVL